MAPEIVRGEDHGFSVDYWSLGVCLFELSSGTLPYTGNEPQ